MGATRVPPRLTAAGAGAGALSGFALIVLFFALYSWLNTGTIAVAALVDLIPVALLAALTGAVAGAIGGRRFAHYYALRPTASAAEHEERWERR
jgi:hypothetical protein